MDTVTSGEITVEGEKISNYNENQLTDYRAENIGFIFQFYNILPTLTVLENVQLINDIVKEPKDAKEILKEVYQALEEKGYNPINQIVGYILSGDPTYITSHNNARSLIMKAERDELVEEVVRYFIEGKGL